MNTSELIQPRHLERKAMIYVRQSTPSQVVTNKESQRMQYALREQATLFGWHEQDTHVIDADLGRSGASVEQREGFQYLVAQIALDAVGILLAFDATRLARNCSHWYQLLDLCGHHNCLIADRDGVYDPTSINGRLLLGLKGQISELELHTIRTRLTAGILSKAQRGELGLTLPTGLIRTDGVVTKHASAEVRKCIDLIFATFLEQKSVAQTVRWFIKNDLLLPRRDARGDIRWKRTTAASISSFLNNPAYAGAAAYGRSRWKKSENTGKMQQKKLPPQQWRYCVQGKYPEYISWDTFDRIQTMLRDNYAEYALGDAQKKTLLRSLIDKVVIHRLAPDQVQTRVVWRGGAAISDMVRVTVGKFAWLSDAAGMEAAIKRMTAEGHSDATIAEHLTAAGHHSPRADKVLESTVRLARLRLGILRTAHQSHPRRVEGFLTITQLAKKLGVSRWWISDRIHNGTIKARKDKKNRCYLFPSTPATLAKLSALVAEYQRQLGCGKGHQDD